MTLGHADHGKTTLITAISKVLSTNVVSEKVDLVTFAAAPEEIDSGVVIKVSRVESVNSNRQYTHIDCPEHTDCVKIMIVSPIEIVGAILVVAADEGLSDQTIEQIMLARQTGIHRIVVYLNKMDLVEDHSGIELLEADLKNELANYGFGESPVIKGSALGAVNGDPLWTNTISELMNALDLHIRIPINNNEKPFLMPVEDVFSVTQRGTAVTGRIERGIVKDQQEIEIVGLSDENRKVTLSEIEIDGKPSDQGMSGDQAALFFRGVAREEIEVGQIVAKIGSVSPSVKFTAQLYMLTASEGGRHKPFFNNYKPQFYFRNAGVQGFIKLPEGVEMVAPGANMEISVELQTPVILEEGLRFTIFDNDRMVGIGKVIAAVS
ncbi:MAG: hypothetical protein RL742_17 [Bacteroidota bacterium]